MTDSQVTIHKSGAVSFSGTDAVQLFRALALAQALSLYAKTGMVPTRGITATQLLKLASELTGKRYARGTHAQAGEDVRVWYETMKAAMPVEVRA